MRVENKVIIVTGAGGGIGEGIAKRLAAEGASVIVNDINSALGEKVVTEITAAGGTASFFAADVTKSSDVKALVDTAVQRSAPAVTHCSGPGTSKGPWQRRCAVLPLWNAGGTTLAMTRLSQLVCRHCHP